MCKHARHLDFCVNAAANVDVFMQTLDWDNAARQFRICSRKA